jgi:DNA polymerase sigma
MQSGFNNMPVQSSPDQIDSSGKNTPSGANNNFRPVMISDQLENTHLTEQSQAFIPTNKGSSRQAEQQNNSQNSSQYTSPFKQGMNQNMNYSNQQPVQNNMMQTNQQMNVLGQMPNQF